MPNNAPEIRVHAKLRIQATEYSRPFAYIPRGLCHNRIGFIIQRLHFRDGSVHLLCRVPPPTTEEICVRHRICLGAIPVDIFNWNLIMQSETAKQ